MTRICAVAAFAALAFNALPANAGAITDFHIFGHTSVDIGNGSGNATMPLGPIGSNGGIKVGTTADITDVSGGGAVEIGGDTDTAAGGDIVSGGDVTLGANATVSGNIDAGGNGIFYNSSNTIGGNLTLGGTITSGTPNVTGATTQNGTPTAHMAITVPAASSFSTSSVMDITGGTLSTVNFGPGSYRDLSVGNSSNIELSAPGDYIFNSWTAMTTVNLKLDLDAGPFRIYIVGDASFGNGLDIFDLSSNTQLDPTNATDALLAGNLYFEVGGSFSTGTTSDWFGTIFAPNGNIDLFGGSAFAGALYAGNVVTLGADVNGKYVPANNLPTQFNGSTIPEPGTLVLFGIGLAGLGLARRRRTA